METPTNKLDEFGYREIKMAAELLTAYVEQDHEFLGDGIQLWFNQNSGKVFLSDEDFNVAMMNGDKLEQWFNCPNCGYEGFKEEMKHGKGDKDCEEYLKDIGVSE